MSAANHNVPALYAGALSFFCIAGGTAGFVRRGSVASMAAGGLIGLLYAYLAFTWANAKTSDVSSNRLLAIGVSLLLGAGMLQRAIASGFARVPTIVALAGISSAGVFAVIAQ
jgi:uncharacterized membrane protein (UPF0136 family)